MVQAISFSKLGCDASVSDFGRHLASVHPLDDKTTAQTRVQLQIVNQLEFQLTKEKDRLMSMMKHLRMELNKNGELTPIASLTTPTTTPTTTTSSFESRMKGAPSPISTLSHLDLLQSSIERGELVRIFSFTFWKCKETCSLLKERFSRNDTTAT